MLKIFALIFVFCTTMIFAAPLSNVRTKALPGTVALTFDDGPSPIYTPQILKILKENGVHATFFVVAGNAKAHPELLKEIVANGNAVGNHSMTHPMLTRMSNKQLQYQIVKSKEIIQKIIGKPPVCFRPPFGVTNKHIKSIIQANNMVQVPIGYNTFDYNSPGVQKIVNAVLQHAHSGQVFLLHDGYKHRQQTVQALPEIIKGIRAKGLGFSVICMN